MGVVIVDTSALIFLARLRRLGLLSRLGAVILPVPVLEELRRGREKDADTVSHVEQWITDRAVEVRSVALPTDFWPTLGAGERSVLLLAETISATTVVIDERPARRVAKHLRHAVMSTPYLLLLAAGRGWTTPLQARGDLERLVGLGYFLDARLFADLLDELKELERSRGRRSAGR